MPNDESISNGKARMKRSRLRHSSAGWQGPDMKPQMIFKLVVMGGLIVAVGQLLHGHDVLTGIALVLLFLWAVAKVIAAIVVRRRGEPPGSGGGGSWPAGSAVPRPPGGRPPALSAASEVK